MMLIFSITFHCHYDICGRCSTGPIQFRWLKGYIYSSCYYHPEIGSINLTHSDKIYPWLCACDVCYIILCYLLHIHSGKTGILCLLLLCSLWWVQIVGYVLACWSCSLVCTLHHHIIIIAQTYLKIWTYKMPVKIYSVECTSKIKRIFSVFHLTIHGAMCFQFTHFPCEDWENRHFVSLSSNRKYELLSIV